MKTLKDFEQLRYCVMDSEGTIEEMTIADYLEKYFAGYGFPFKGNTGTLVVVEGIDDDGDKAWQVCVNAPGRGITRYWGEIHCNEEDAQADRLQCLSDCEDEDDGSANAPPYFNTLLEAREWCLMNLFTFSLKKYGDGNWRWYHPNDFDKNIFIYISELKEKDADWFKNIVQNIKECQE